MWSKLRKYEFSQDGLRANYRRVKTILECQSFGWSTDLLIAAMNQNLDFSDLRIGSPLFLHLWGNAELWHSREEMLQIVLNMADLPKDLSGELEQNDYLVARISPDLPPDHGFWKSFANVVSSVFVGSKMCQKTLFAKQIHQFRYVISSQQAQYIRNHFKQPGLSDREALAIFLKRKKGQTWWRRNADYTLYESARLHNKLSLMGDDAMYPNGHFSINIKILLGFHTEFILDNEGNFLNEVDAERVWDKGIINGASFNYAEKNDKRHWELDIAPVKAHDPKFRKQTVKGYRSPNKQKRRLSLTSQDYHWSYFNRKGLFASNNRSSAKLVAREIRRMKRLISKS
jgi:hypothetical protein